MARSDGGCDSCGATLPADARFCMSCGAPTGSVSIEVRKTVTALFCDVVGSTELAGSRHLEVHRREMEQWFTVVSAVVARHGGTVEKYAGDAVLAVFGVPASHEDDALRACRTALDVLATSTLATRVGLETGEVVVADLARGSTFVSGPPVNLAARLQSAAAPGQALVGPACHRLVRDLAVTEELEPLDLKGVGGPVPARRLLALSLPTEPAARGSLLGREREMGLLHHMLERAVHDRTCQVVTVVGVAGLGKTRLAAEFLALAAPRVRVLRGRCLPYGDRLRRAPHVTGWG